MSDQLTQQEQLIQQIDERIKTFLKSCERRDGKKFNIESLQRNSLGIITTIKGTVEAIKDEQAKLIITEPMTWNIEGKSLSQNVGYDLVVNEPVTKVEPEPPVIKAEPESVTKVAPETNSPPFIPIKDQPSVKAAKPWWKFGK
jgi:hypothetical protein